MMVPIKDPRDVIYTERGLFIKTPENYGRLSIGQEGVSGGGRKRGSSLRAVWRKALDYAEWFLGGVDRRGTRYW